MKTALYRILRIDDPTAIGKAAPATPAVTFVCTIRDNGRVVDEIRNTNIGTLMRMKVRMHPTAVTVSSLFDPGTGAPKAAPRVRELEEIFA